MRTRSTAVTVALVAVVMSGGAAMAASMAIPDKHRTETVPRAGGTSEAFVNSPEVLSAAAFAVDEHNKASGQHVRLSHVVRARSQLVAGTMYSLTLMTTGPVGPALYEARIWVKPWERFRKLEVFKPA
ncbi:hypothetical protein I5Q34_33885 [Streptomyces sp. AV19]|uniref:cystatin domain-containing protein n=1 Tax=Streptomyces sp. AV19 TaxID=2793068 RepID=UPI0018FEF9F7|nr:cystatin domain-containing protein [Streptomyces sp. AV19]MBH1939193.1 hypothetical protein [Streptomyces sp. AV19]MDG4536923.1 cystatin domain-containing protein [Streptomyces sp. AV19]